MEDNKTKWLLLLLLAIVLFLFGLNTGNLSFNFLSILLSFVVYKYGYKTLFSEFDKQREDKLAHKRYIRDAIRTKNLGGNSSD